MKMRLEMFVPSLPTPSENTALRLLLSGVGAASLLGSAALAQSATSSINGSAPGDGFGQSIERYVDINNDGYIDMIVGAPSVLASGHISIVSGKYIATGVGPAILWTVAAPIAGTRFGWSVANLGDVTGDGVADIAVGAPIPVGAPVPYDYLYIVSGASHAIVATKSNLGSHERFAWALASAGDFDGDGVNDIAVGNPGAFNGSRVQILSSALMLAGAANPVVFTFGQPTSNSSFGSSLSRGDLDGDGKPEWAIGAPGANGLGGAVYVYGGVNHNLLVALNGTGGELLGTSVCMKFDVTNDGIIDVVAGAPNYNGAGSERGEAIVYSGARILAAALPYDLRHWQGSVDGEHFGNSVVSTADINGDFIHDVVVGAPDRSSIFAPGAGFVQVFSGLTGQSLGSLNGLPGDHLGLCVADAWAYDNNFGFEFAVGAPQSDVNGLDAGLMRIVTLFPAWPSSYCVAKVNSLGCTPQISYQGSPSLTSAASFLIKAANVINNKSALLLYGQGVSSAPFQGGTLCVASPIKRVGGQTSGGNPPPNDCSGTLSFNFNAHIQSGIDPALILGRQLFAQWWTRDPGSPSTTGLTNALNFVINP